MFFWESLQTAFNLIGSLDREVTAAVRTSLTVSAWAICISALAGIPAGVAIAINNFPLKRALLTLLNTLMAMPTVVIGLLVYAFISRQGPLGELGLLFTPAAMVIGQTLLALPIVIHYCVSTIKGADPRILPTVATLGAGPIQGTIQLVREVRFGIMAAVIAAFGRVIAEVGVAMMLGGNIRGYTRTMTTAIALETSKGEFAFGLALGGILMAIAFAVNLALNLLQER